MARDDTAHARPRSRARALHGDLSVRAPQINPESGFIVSELARLLGILFSILLVVYLISRC